MCWGTSFNLLPEVFDMDDNDGLVRAENSQPQGNYFVLEIDEADLVKFQQVADSCPSGVFKIS